MIPISIIILLKDSVLCVKDTEKEDELKAMVTAWEAEQPGRTKKVINTVTIEYSVEKLEMSTLTIY